MLPVRVVLVSSPGRATEPHWSAAAAADLAAALLAAGVGVEWFHVAAAQSASPNVPGARVHHRVPPRALAVHAVSAAMQHLELERDLVRSLRAEHAAAVLHLGVGAGGSPNVLWLAERMGSRVFAVVRSAEIVCQRGDLVHADGLACTRHDDAERCRSCCRRSWWRSPQPDEFQNRWDLLFGGLLVATAVFVRDAPEAEQLVAHGLAPRQLFAEHGTDAIVRRVLGRS